MKKEKQEKKSRFSGYVIPDHLKKHRSQESEPIHMWMVELTLTSGEVHSFYIKAKDYGDALQRASRYDYLADMPNQMNKGFVCRS